MSTDRELLLAAAKTAGLELRGWSDSWMDEPGASGFQLKNFDRWNPLTDDGDALRLAVKLRIMVDPDGAIYTVATATPKGRGEFMAHEKHREDPYAATRRAIVRAAASLAQAGEPQPTKETP